MNIAILYHRNGNIELQVNFVFWHTLLWARRIRLMLNNVYLGEQQRTQQALDSPDTLVFGCFASHPCFASFILGPADSLLSCQRTGSLCHRHQKGIWTALLIYEAWGCVLHHRSSLSLSLASQSCYFDVFSSSTQAFLPLTWWTKILAFQRRCTAASPPADTHALGMYLVWLIAISEWISNADVSECSGSTEQQMSFLSICNFCSTGEFFNTAAVLLCLQWWYLVSFVRFDLLMHQNLSLLDRCKVSHLMIWIIKRCNWN